MVSIRRSLSVLSFISNLCVSLLLVFFKLGITVGSLILLIQVYLGLLLRRVVLHPPSKVQVGPRITVRAILLRAAASVIRDILVPWLSPSVRLGARIVGGLLLWLVRDPILQPQSRFLPQNIQIVNGTVQVAETLVRVAGVGHVHVAVVRAGLHE